MRMGTRGSELALAQSRMVARSLEALHPGLTVTEVIIKTTGDQKADVPLQSLGGKGAFTKEIEQALLDGTIDFAVHSLKDLPTTLPEGLALAAVPPRADPRDVLIGSSLESLSAGSVVGTGSARRVAQLRAVRPDLEFVGIRGNLPTRCAKWRRGEFSAIVLAAAGLSRLGLEACGLSPEEVHPLRSEDCLPAPGQGILGLEIRGSDAETRRLLAALDDPRSRIGMLAERAFLAELEGNCSLPAGCLALVEGDQVVLEGMLGDESGRLERSRVTGPDPEALGRGLARQLRERLG